MSNPTTLNPTLFEIMRELVAVRGSLDQAEARWNDPLALVARLNEIAPEVAAQLNHDRWLAPCPGCATMLQVIPPSDRTEIEAALRPRPAAGRNWEPGVSVDELLAENADLGIKEHAHTVNGTG